MTKQKIRVDHVARIEGHGDINLTIEDDRVVDCTFSVTEAARLFESMVKGRPFDQAPYISSRVCGICSASHTITDILAIERVFGVNVTDRTKALRQLLVYGSYLQNHATHLFVFAAPDFMGHKSVFPIAEEAPEIFKSALALKSLGNELCTKIGGRSIHPITAVVGGFTNEISKDEYLALAEKLDEQLEFASTCVDLFRGFDTLPLITEGDFLAMKAPTEDQLEALGATEPLDDPTSPYAYPVMASDTLEFVRGMALVDDPQNPDAVDPYDFDAQDYRKEIEEYPVDHSAAFFSKATRTGKPFMASALSRINTNWNGLVDQARFAAAKAGLRPFEFNPFADNIAQAVELIDALTRCAAMCRRLAREGYEGSSTPVDFEVSAGVGVGFTEAPRGALFHELEIDDSGIIQRANIITPTAQNIANMENDMKKLAEMMIADGASQEDIQLEIEKLVRAYDPCLSCSVH